MMNWIYQSDPEHWTLTIGGWRAVVLPVGEEGQWFGFVERLEPLHQRSKRPLFDWAADARAWCISELARLRTVS